MVIASIFWHSSCFSARFFVCSAFRLSNIKYLGNLVEYCVYSIEYFLDENRGVDGSVIDACLIEGNVLRLSGFGWGQQRHNTHTPAHIKGWSYANPARNYRICDNIFDRAAYRMLHLVCEQPESLPKLDGNVYIQHAGGLLGQYGANAAAEPPVLPFDEAAHRRYATVYCAFMRLHPGLKETFKALKEIP